MYIENVFNKVFPHFFTRCFHPLLFNYSNPSLFSRTQPSIPFWPLDLRLGLTYILVPTPCSSFHTLVHGSNAKFRPCRNQTLPNPDPTESSFCWIQTLSNPDPAVSRPCRIQTQPNQDPAEFRPCQIQNPLTEEESSMTWQRRYDQLKSGCPRAKCLELFPNSTAVPHPLTHSFFFKRRDFSNPGTSSKL